MPAYRLGPSESGGYRNILPLDQKPSSKVGAGLTYVLVFALGLIGGGVGSSLFEDRTSGSPRDKAAVGHP